MVMTPDSGFGHSELILPQAQREHLRALDNPLVVLRSHEFSASPGSLPMRLSYVRGDLPVLISGQENIEKSPIVVLANSGAQLQNSHHYPLRGVHRTSSDIIQHNAIAAAPSVLAFTAPGDEFVYPTNDPETSEKILQLIAASYGLIGIDLTDQYTPVMSTDAWIKDNAGRVSVLPHVLEPELMASYGETGEVKTSMLRHALENVAAYTKNGAQRWWEINDVPTPKTRYYNLGKINPGDVEKDILRAFQGFGQCVINIYDGSGGFGIVFARIDEIFPHLASIFANQKIQVQGVLPLMASPCSIANITPESSDVLLVTEQRFSSPGIYMGNIWHRGYGEELGLQIDDFTDVNTRALDVLRNAGVVGQVNVDSLVLSEKDALDYCTRTTLMREANIRPAGSSVILRIIKGNIDGQPIERVHTRMGVPLKTKALRSPIDVVGKINKRVKDDRIRVVVINYNPLVQVGSLAFIAADGVSEEDLLKQEVEIINYLREI